MWDSEKMFIALLGLIVLTACGAVTTYFVNRSPIERAADACETACGRLVVRVSLNECVCIGGTRP